MVMYICLVVCIRTHSPSVTFLCVHCMQVKTTLAKRVDSFTFTLDQLKDVQELRDCIAQCKDYIAALRDFALDEASSEVSSEQ